MTVATTLYHPPAPPRRSEAMTFARLLLNRRRDLLALLPDSAYQVLMSRVPGTRQPIWIVNHPKTVQQVLATDAALFRPADLMVAGLAPFVGDGLPVSDGPASERQHALLAEAFGRPRLASTLAGVAAAVADMTRALGGLAPGAEITLDILAERLSADMHGRMLVSRPAASPEGRDLTDALAAITAATARLDPAQLFSSGARDLPEPDAATRAAADGLRAVLRALVDQRIAAPESGADDILGILIAAGDPQTGRGLAPGEIVDLLASLLLAGHPTLTSHLTWALFLLGQQPDVARRVAKEAVSATDGGALSGSSVGRLPFARQIVREALRLYPPAPFLLRTAREAVKLRKFDVAAGDLVVISPWLIHRHDQFWTDPDAFDPERFGPDAQHTPGAFLPFGVGARACVGAAVSQFAGMLALAGISRTVRLEVVDAKSVMPACGMTLRPEAPIRARLFPV